MIKSNLDSGLRRFFLLSQNHYLHRLKILTVKAKIILVDLKRNKNQIKQFCLENFFNGILSDFSKFNFESF